MKSAKPLVILPSDWDIHPCTNYNFSRKLQVKRQCWISSRGRVQTQMYSEYKVTKLGIWEAHKWQPRMSLWKFMQNPRPSHSHTRKVASNSSLLIPSFLPPTHLIHTTKKKHKKITTHFFDTNVLPKINLSLERSHQLIPLELASDFLLYLYYN